ncbi:stereocilin [Strix aluco]|uniref:stereocilin n=1 Tax=Strix aluco TaxID=111821 RepID=UPI003DA551EF
MGLPAGTHRWPVKVRRLPERLLPQIESQQRGGRQRGQPGPGPLSRYRELREQRRHSPAERRGIGTGTRLYGTPGAVQSPPAAPTPRRRAPGPAGGAADRTGTAVTGGGQRAAGEWGVPSRPDQPPPWLRGDPALGLLPQPAQTDRLPPDRAVPPGPGSVFPPAGFPASIMQELGTVCGGGLGLQPRAETCGSRPRREERRRRDGRVPSRLWAAAAAAATGPRLRSCFRRDRRRAPARRARPGAEERGGGAGRGPRAVQTPPEQRAGAAGRPDAGGGGGTGDPAHRQRRALPPGAPPPSDGRLSPQGRCRSCYSGESGRRTAPSLPRARSRLRGSLGPPGARGAAGLADTPRDRDWPGHEPCRAPRRAGRGRAGCRGGALIRSLPSRGFHHNLSWDARGLGFAAGVLPAPPPLAGCLQPVPRAAAAVPPGQPSLHPPVLEAACNDSVPALPGVSNFTVYLYCNLFNSSRGSGQHPGDLGAACSSAAWYLSAGSAWARACRERYPAQFNSTVCSNTSLRGTPGPQQVLLERLCADPARGAAGARLPPRSGCPLGARWEDAWSCFLGSRPPRGARPCASGSRELLPTDRRARLSRLCRGPPPRAQTPSASEPCSLGGRGLGTRGNAGLLELCGTARPGCFPEPACTNASLPPLLGHPQPAVGLRCPGTLPRGHCLLQQLLALLPLSPRLDAADLCPDPAAYLLGLASQLLRCREEAPGWVPHVNYLLRLLDRSLALSGREEAGQAAGEQLSEAILLSSLLDNTSFWALLRANASTGILRAVGQYLRWEPRASAKWELLICFSAVLWDLLQDSEGAPALDILVQEYLQMPEESFEGLLLAAGPEAVQRFLALLHRVGLRLRGEVPSPVSGEEGLQSLAVLLLRRLPHLTPELFVSLSQFIPFMAVSDIARLPPALLANESVLAALRTHSALLTPGQKAAFARRLLQAPSLGAVPTWPLGFLHAVLPLLPHLPLPCFLQLTPQQVWGLGDAWQLLQLGLVQGRHVAGSLANGSHAAGPELGRRLGALACFLSPKELQDLAWLRDPRGTVEQSLLACAAAGTLRQHGRVMLALAELLRSTSLAMVSPGELPAWRGVLPEMGVGFLERLSAAQLSALLPRLRPTQLTRAQASFLLARAIRGDNVSVGEAARLCPLLPGLGPASLAAVLAPLRIQGCECLGPALPLLSAAQTVSLLQALQRPDGWPRCLLPLLPLQLLRPRAQALWGALRDLNLPWSPQQAQLLWREVGAGTNRSHRTAGALGSLVVGMSCAALQELDREDFLGALRTLFAQPRSLPASLRRCVQEEVLGRPELSREELAWLGPRFLMELPAKLVEMLPDAVMRLVLDHATHQPRSLLALPAARQAALARGALRSLRLPAGMELAGEVLDQLGPLVGFLDRETVARVQPESLLPRLGDLQDACLDTEVAAELGRLLLSEQALGPPPSWRLSTLQQLGRLIFLLPPESLRAIPGDLLNRDTVEQLLQSQRDWEQSELGRLCHPQGTLGKGPSPQEVLMAPLVAAAGPGDRGETVRSPPEPCAHPCSSCPWCPAMPCPLTSCPVPGVPMLSPSWADPVSLVPAVPILSPPGWCVPRTQCPHAVPSLGWPCVPSTWCPHPVPSWLVCPPHVGALGPGLATQASSAAPVPSCADIRATFPAAWSAAQLAAMAPLQLEGCLGLLGQDPALRPDQLQAVLGQVRRLGEPELRELLLPDWGALSALGELDGWSPEQMRAVVSTFLRQRGASTRDLGLPELVALGHLLCGLPVAELWGLDSWELSKAAPFLGSLSLRCTEQQAEVLAAHLTSSAAFGPADAWGPEIFTEVGTLAAGLPDIVLSALVPEQLWALTPRAIAAVPAPKFAVVFGPAQLRTLSSAQATAVTLGQRQWLSSAQRWALASAQREGEAAQDGQGRSRARAQSGFPLALLLCLPHCFL